MLAGVVIAPQWGAGMFSISYPAHWAGLKDGAPLALNWEM